MRQLARQRALEAQAILQELRRTVRGHIFHKIKPPQQRYYYNPGQLSVALRLFSKRDHTVAEPSITDAIEKPALNTVNVAGSPAGNRHITLGGDAGETARE